MLDVFRCTKHTHTDPHTRTNNDIPGMRMTPFPKGVVTVLSSPIGVLVVIKAERSKCLI